jgi:uncharacterized lipoprotein YajG
MRKILFLLWALVLLTACSGTAQSIINSFADNLIDNLNF